MYGVHQKVKCIDGSWGTATGSAFQILHCPNLPKVGSIYTIRTIERVTAIFADGPAWFVRLVEVVNPTNPNLGKGGVEPVFYATHFVPLSGLTNIDFAHEILKNPNRVVKRSKEEVVIFKKGRRRERA